MAYVLKRSAKIIEEIQLGDEHITINLDVDTIALEFNKRYNTIILAEQKLKMVQAQERRTPESVNQAMEAYGNGVIELFGLVFGEENTNKILAFYENKYYEMSREVFPFIIEVVAPAIKKELEIQRNRNTNNYKQNKAGIFNRKQRRKMGL